MTLIFIGGLDEKIKFTFKMYDFDDDGYVNPHDIQLFMSYMPLNQNIDLKQVNNLLKQKGYHNLKSNQDNPQDNNSYGLKKKSEGLFSQADGRNLEHSDRINDQKEIKAYTNYIFDEKITGVKNNKMDYKTY